MNTAIESIHFDMDDKLKHLILKKTADFNKLFEATESCKVILEQKNDDKNKKKVVEISLNVPQSRLFAKHQAQTFELALETAIDQIKQQLKKYKDKKSNIDPYAIESQTSR